MSLGPHAARRLGGKVLLTHDQGGWTALSEAEYDALLAGAEPEALKGTGFLRRFFDFEAAARAAAARGLAAWRGPGNHVLLLEGMALETVKAAVDFAFTTPAPQLTLTLVARDLEAGWPAVWLAVQYARRRSEWAKRPALLCARAETGWSPKRADFLRAHGVERRAELWTSRRPPAFGQADRALLHVDGGDGAAWAEALRRLGMEGALLRPAARPAAFLSFYRSFRRERGPVRDELAEAFMAGRPWDLPGMDLTAELAYRADGGVYTSELAGELGRLGALGTLRYEDLAGSPAARAFLAAGQGDNQPRCAQCAYKPFCAVPPSRHLADQGTLWGRLPDSPSCRVNMGVLDLLFLEKIAGK